MTFIILCNFDIKNNSEINYATSAAIGREEAINSYFCPSEQNHVIYGRVFLSHEDFKMTMRSFYSTGGLFPRWRIKTSPLILQSEGDKKKEDINN